MDVRLVYGFAVLLLVASAGNAADVAYRHPDLTIVAKEEPLDAVLQALGREMRIYVKVPTGLNPPVNCNIQSQSITQAFKTLLGDLSYSLEWESGGERLVGLTILSSGGEAAATAVSARTQAAQQPEIPVATEIGNQGAGAPVAAVKQPIPGADHDYTMAQQQARMAREREARDAEMRATVESQGLELPD